jgi:hypothetical protein
LPMPKPRAIPIRVHSSSVPTILARAHRASASHTAASASASASVGDSGAAGGPGQASDPPGLVRLFNTSNPAIASHLDRYGPWLGHSFVFTGGGLRFLTQRLSVTHISAPVGEAARWSGVCGRGVLKPPPPYQRPLYGKEELKPPPEDEVRSKQQAFLLGQPGAYLAEHLVPEVVRVYLERTGAVYRVGDPGVSVPIAFSDSSYICLRTMYKFLACSHHRRPKRDEVRLAEGDLSNTAPRRGLAGLLGYVTKLAQVGVHLVCGCWVWMLGVGGWRPVGVGCGCWVWVGAMARVCLELGVW